MGREDDSLRLWNFCVAHQRDDPEQSGGRFLRGFCGPDGVVGDQGLLYNRPAADSVILRVVELRVLVLAPFGEFRGGRLGSGGTGNTFGAAARRQRADMTFWAHEMGHSK